MKIIEKAIHRLLVDKPFYAHLFLNSKIVYDDPRCATASVGLGKDGVVMSFNNDFISSHTPKEVAGVIEHESLHLLFDHIKDFDKKLYNQHIVNISMDCAINQYISVLPKGGVTLERLSALLGKELLPEQSWEYYYEQLIQDKDKFIKEQTIDVHINPDGEMTDGDGNPISDDVKKAILKATVDKSIKDADGRVPNAVTKVYDQLFGVPKINWKQMLRNFIAKTTATTFRNTRKKSNRRFGLDIPGRLKKRELVLGVCVDSSGSVSDESFKAFMDEIYDISKNTSKTILIDADCIVQDVKVIKKNQKFNPTRTGMGGTAYQPAIDEALKNNCDAIIYFGDFDCADTPKNPHVPFLWVGVGISPPPANFGSVIRI